MKYITTTLPNGLRVIQMPSESTVVYCGYQINTGSRNELPGEEGLAHFCEHMTFKGTDKRTAWNIINCLESVGGDLNAYTAKAHTVFHAIVPKEYTNRAIGLLTDIVFHSTYPQQEIDKEVEVICDEIESYNDSPSDLIYDDFENILFKGHQLGHNVLGTKDNVRSFTTADALRFTGKYYRPENAIFYIYGGSGGTTIPKLLQKAFSKYCSEPKETVKPIITIDKAQPATALKPNPSTFCFDKGTHQAHVMLGCLAYSEKEYCGIKGWAMDLLNNMIGGPAMNSQLNIKLRERKGLVYSVDSSWGVYSDTGYWTVYFGCDAKDIDHCLRIVHKVLDSYREKPLSERKLNAAKKQLKGQIRIDRDNNRDSFAQDFGCVFLHENRQYDVDALCKGIDSVTPQDIQNVANEIFSPDRLTTLIYK